jgi:hypothetical protein
MPSTLHPIAYRPAIAVRTSPTGLDCETGIGDCTPAQSNLNPRADTTPPTARRAGEWRSARVSHRGSAHYLQKR